MPPEKTRLRPDAADTARYIGGLARELRELASKADLGFMAYLLAMVEDDAEATVRRLAEEKPTSAIR
jgi:hypothetical protein